jgi:hypothetical protein
MSPGAIRGRAAWHECALTNVPPMTAYISAHAARQIDGLGG